MNENQELVQPLWIYANDNSNDLSTWPSTIRLIIQCYPIYAFPEEKKMMVREVELTLWLASTQ